MILTVRLKKEQERLLRRATRLWRRPQSDIVREAIAEYVVRRLETPDKSAQELLGPWLGCVDSGGRNLSVDSGRKFRGLLRSRHESRPR